MRLIFHGELAKICGPHADMQADTVAEAVEGYSRQQPDWPRDMRISIVGFDSVEKLEQWAEEVHVLPTLYGGGGKFGTIVLGAAMIGLALIPGGQAGSFLVGSLHASLLVSGALMALQGVMGIFMKSPKATSTSDPEASKYLGINKNTTDSGTAITMAWGRIDLQPHWLSLQSDSTNISYGVFPANP